MAKAARLSDFEKDEVWFVEDPSRVVRIVAQTTIEQPGDNPDEVISKPAVEVRATIPTVPIKGFVTEKQAQQGQIILNALKGQREDLEYDDRVWSETWAERFVHPLRSNRGAVEVNETAPLILQVYCYSTEGRETERNRTSPIVGKKIVATKASGAAFPDPQKAKA